MFFCRKSSWWLHVFSEISSWVPHVFFRNASWFLHIYEESRLVSFNQKIYTFYKKNEENTIMRKQENMRICRRTSFTLTLPFAGSTTISVSMATHAYRKRLLTFLSTNGRGKGVMSTPSTTKKSNILEAVLLAYEAYRSDQISSTIESS